MTKEEFDKFQMLTEEEQFEATQKWTSEQCVEYIIQLNNGEYLTLDEAKEFSKQNLKKLYGINDGDN